jgi:hypothetical protein
MSALWAAAGRGEAGRGATGGDATGGDATRESSSGAVAAFGAASGGDAVTVGGAKSAWQAARTRQSQKRISQ